VQAVRNVSFDLTGGETLAIIGESGSGKSTLALSLVSLLPAGARTTSGQILYVRRSGHVLDVRHLPSEALRQFRWAECALVFQAALNAFNPVLTIWEQFLDTARAHTRWSPPTVRTRADELLELVNLDPERVLPAYPHELSGGMRQRVLLALSLLLEPRVIVLDEPTTALDVLTQRSIIELLRTIKRRLGCAMMFISHDLSLAAEIADHVITLYAGRIVETAGVDDLFYRPRHPYSVGLLKAVPRVSGALGELASIPGSPPDLVRLPRGCAYHPRCPFGMVACTEVDPPLEPVDAPDHAAACLRWLAVAQAVDAQRHGAVDRVAVTSSGAAQ
jgi:peptide/nickel transport system ATP-binding protein